MKFLNVPISVEARKGVPCRIRWGRRTYAVRRLLDFWILQSRWWAREEKRVYFRVETDGGVMEIYRGEKREEPQSGVQASRLDGRTAEKAHPPFVEGDTHTREVRQTESPYRPDAAALAGRHSESDADRVQASGKPPYRDSSKSEAQVRWTLSKVID